AALSISTPPHHAPHRPQSPLPRAIASVHAIGRMCSHCAYVAYTHRMLVRSQYRRSFAYASLRSTLPHGACWRMGLMVRSISLFPLPALPTRLAVLSIPALEVSLKRS